MFSEAAFRAKLSAFPTSTVATGPFSTTWFQGRAQLKRLEKMSQAAKNSCWVVSFFGMFVWVNDGEWHRIHLVVLGAKYSFRYFGIWVDISLVWFKFAPLFSSLQLFWNHLVLTADLQSSAGWPESLGNGPTCGRSAPSMTKPLLSDT